MPAYIGKEIGGFRVLEKIGEGGMAKVYKAFQPAFNRVVALKILPDYYATDDKYIQRFQQEARIIANLEHRHILPVYAVGEENGTAFLAMRYLKAGTLKDVLANAPDHRLSLQDAVQVTTQMAEALDHAHQKNIVHRDVKPSNIMMDADGYAYLTDFGIAKVLEGSLELTATGASLGTPAYMSPEQGSGKAVNGRSDVYSLGVVLYEILTGRAPFRAETPLAIIVAHIQEPLPLPRSLNPEIPEAVEQVLLKALAKDPNDRYQSASEFGRALRQTVAAMGIELPSQEFSDSLRGLCERVSVDKPSNDLTIDERSLIRQSGKPKKEKPSPLMIGGLIAAVVVVCLGSVAGIYFGTDLLKPGSSQSAAAVEPVLMSLPDETQVSEVEDPILFPTETDLASPTIAPLETSVPTATVFATGTPVGIEAGFFKVNEKDQAALVFIPSAEFTMGLTDAQVQQLQYTAEDCLGSIEASTPAHPVYLDAYWIYKHEVTNWEYRQCVAAGACDPPNKFGSVYRSNYYENDLYNNYPVVMVNWEDASNYCNWAGGRLPTSAEWEYAARGDDGRLYPWGNQTPTVFLANFNNEVGDTEPVTDWAEGVSPFGLYHMSGNVFEWVGDWYSSTYYQRSTYANPTGPANETGELSRRALRGGSWEWDEGCSNAVVQDYWEQSESGLGVGFRCVIPYTP